jgi:hypothetical protein
MTRSEGPLTGRGLLAMWVLAAVVLGGLLVIAQRTRGPLDDPDPAYQRPGILDLGALPAPAPAVTGDIPRHGRPAVVFFDRPSLLPGLCQALARIRLAATADLVIVTPTGSAGCGALPVVEDSDGRLAEAYGMRSPADEGPPVGYAVVDGQGRIRYRTLDPTVATELPEVATILAAL